MKILILGSSGTLGNYTYHYLKKKFKVFSNGLNKRKIDLTNKKNIYLLIKQIQPNIIINCAAITNISFAEKNKKITYNTNVKIVKNLINIKKKYNFWLIHVSTDNFYNSTKPNNEKTKLYLLNYYAKSKRLSEIVCSKKALILRTNFFGKSKYMDSFSDFVFNSFKKKKRFFLFHDIKFNPLRLESFCKILKNLIKKNYGEEGIYNLGSKSCISKLEFALIFSKKLNIYNKNYSKCSINYFFKEKRTKNMCMNISKFEKKFGVKLPFLKKEITTEARKNY